MSIMSEVNDTVVAATFIKKKKNYMSPYGSKPSKPSLMSAIYNIMITQIIVSWHALHIIPHYDWQYFSPLGTYSVFGVCVRV